MGAVSKHQIVSTAADDVESLLPGEVESIVEISLTSIGNGTEERPLFGGNGIGQGDAQQGEAAVGTGCSLGKEVLNGGAVAIGTDFQIIALPDGLHALAAPNTVLVGDAFKMAGGFAVFKDQFAFPVAVEHSVFVFDMVGIEADAAFHVVAASQTFERVAASCA